MTNALCIYSYTFSSIEKDEYTKLYEYLKSKKVSVRTAGKGSGAKGLSFDDVDHHLEKIKKDALSDMEDSGSMSSDDSEFNPGRHFDSIRSLLGIFVGCSTITKLPN